jgi:hypothetical protein
MLQPTKIVSETSSKDQKAEVYPIKKFWSKFTHICVQSRTFLKKKLFLNNETHQLTKIVIETSSKDKKAGLSNIEILE